MARSRLDRLLVVDFEETCWQGEAPPGQQPEIIEVGIAEVLVDQEFAIGRTGSYLVRPAFSSVSAYCTQLTGIEGLALRSQGRPLHEVCNRIRKEFGGGAKTWAAWGRDNESIERDCARLGLPRPFSDSYLNLGHLYGLLTGAEKAVGLDQALRELGIPFDGTPHRALDDAVNAARVFAEISAALRPALDLSARAAPRPDPAQAVR